MCYKSNETPLSVLSADIASVNDDFLTKLKTAYSACSYFADEKTRCKGHGLIKSSDGLYTYHDRLVIPRLAQDLRILLLADYHDNNGHPNWRRLLATLLKRFWWERMFFIAKLIALTVLFAIKLSLVDKVLHHCLLWVFLITLEKLWAWTLLRAYLKAPKTISLLF